MKKINLMVMTLMMCLIIISCEKEELKLECNNKIELNLAIHNINRKVTIGDVETYRLTFDKPHNLSINNVFQLKGIESDLNGNNWENLNNTFYKVEKIIKPNYPQTQSITIEFKISPPIEPTNGGYKLNTGKLDFYCL